MENEEYRGIGFLLDIIRDIHTGDSGGKTHVYHTHAFTQQLATGSGGWIEVAVKTQGTGRAYALIGTEMHRRYPRLFTSPLDWKKGDVNPNCEVMKDFAEQFGMELDDMPEDEVVALSPFEWRQDFWDERDRKPPREKGQPQPGDITPPPERARMELEEGRWLYHDNGAHRREGMLTRTCPRCGREDRMPHG